MNPDQKERLLNAELLVDHWQGRYERDTALLRQALEELKAENEVLRAEVDALREALKELISWFPSADTYRRLGFDPKTPMQVLKEAKALLAKGNKA